ncbi:hypothetical protein O181_047961 [Austropuccinia psidii MF-1]|uniref:Uncharacterized protein n=1 Tax=Austropuccinia psidii MF-1 TaxID=1389203 RepID=A0A9Q3DPR4_9BASI|nr:hypothetical protein [Austropuccinia psidii MF-1]
METISKGYFNIPKIQQGITSSRGFIKDQGQVSLSNINDPIKKSLHILINSIPPSKYWKLILKGYSRGSSKPICQVSILHQSTLATKIIQYRISRTTFKGPGKDGEEEEENYVEEEEYDGTEGIPPPVGAFQGTGGPTLAQSHQSEPSLLAIMQQITQNMANLQEDSSSEESRPPAFKTPSMNAPECFDRTKTFKVRSFIQSFKLIFHNDLENISQDRRKVLHAISFLI